MRKKHCTVFLGIMMAMMSGMIISANGLTYVFVMKWGSYGSDDGQFNNASGIAVDRSGNVYIADSWNHRVQKFTSAGVFVTKWGGKGSGDGQFREPADVAVDSSGNVYVADFFNSRVQKFTSSGEFITKWGGFSYPSGVAVDAHDDVYIADTFSSRIQKFTSSGIFITGWGSEGSDDGQFDYPFGVAADSFGNVYVADTLNSRIQKFSSSGDFITKWGSYGSGDYQFNIPTGITVDNAGNVYVADNSNNRVQKFTSSGELIIKWGRYGTNDGLFKNPYDVAVDDSGNVFVVDSNNYRVQKFGPAISAALNIDPNGLNLASHGNWVTVYIQLPEQYYAADIDVTTVLLNDTIPPVLDPKYGFVKNPSEYLVDHNNDGVPEHMLKFDRDAVQSLIHDQANEYDDVTLTVTGRLLGGTPFEGTDTVTARYSRMCHRSPNKL